MRLRSNHQRLTKDNLDPLERVTNERSRLIVVEDTDETTIIASVMVMEEPAERVPSKDTEPPDVKLSRIVRANVVDGSIAIVIGPVEVAPAMSKSVVMPPTAKTHQETKCNWWPRLRGRSS